MTVVLGRKRQSPAVPIPCSNPSVVHFRSAYCSLSVLNRPPSSTMRITPTPRAMSPHDIVRIYVPPPPPEELYDRPSDLRLSHNNNNNVSSEGRSPESDCRTIIQRTPTQELPGSVSTATITSQSMRSLNQQQWTSREEPAIVPSCGLQTTLRDLALYSSQSSLRGGHGSTSSSRRGSMSRKSSGVIVESLAGDCPHIRVTSGGGRDSLTQRHSFGDGGLIHVEYEAILARANQNKPKKESRVMTSFEKLAQMNDTFSFRGSPCGQSEVRREVKQQQSDDEAFSYSFQAMRRSGGVVDQVRSSRGNGSQTRERTKCTSDHNIKYKANGGEGGERRPVGKGQGAGDTGEVEAGHELGTKKKNKKQYDRFFTPDDSEEEFKEGEFAGHEVVSVGKKKRPGHRKEESNNHSSSPSSSTKSLLATPVNETQPLLDAGDATTAQYNFKHSRGVEQVPRRVRHKKVDREEATEEDGYDDGEISSSPTTYKTGSAYYAHRSSSYIPITEDYPGGERVGQQPSVNSSVDVGNKIRIRVNEKGK